MKVGRKIMTNSLKEKVLEEIIIFCNKQGARTFTLKEFHAVHLPVFEAFLPNNKNVAAKVRQQLQQLRNDGAITFVDNRGTYTLRQIPLLDHERKALAANDLQALEKELGHLKLAKPAVISEKREHLIETYVRNTGWAKKAKSIFGTQCLIEECTNRFIKPDNKPYIEVHHIVPLCEGGEDGIWNLSVLCAHHHRMAHFARKSDRHDIRNTLEREVTRRLDEQGITS